MKKTYLLIPLILAIAFVAGYVGYYAPAAKQWEADRKAAKEQAEADRIKAQEDARKLAQEEAKKQLAEFEARKKAREERDAARKKLRDELNDAQARAESTKKGLDNQITQIKNQTEAEKTLKSKLEGELAETKSERDFLQDYAAKVTATAKQFSGMLEKVNQIEKQRAAMAAAQAPAGN